MKKIFQSLILSLTIITSGCITTQESVPVGGQEGQLLIGKRVHVVIERSPGIQVFTPRQAIGIWIRNMGESKDLAGAYDIDDPSLWIAHNIASALAERYTMNVSIHEDYPEKLNANLIISKFDKAEYSYVVRVWTSDWRTGYLPTKWNSYYVSHAVKIELIDLSSGSVIAKGFHTWPSEASEDYPTLDELLANNAKEFKERMAVAAEVSSNYILEEVFSIR